MNYILTLTLFLLITNGVYAYSSTFAIPPTPVPIARRAAEIKGNEKLSSKNVKDQLKDLAEEAKSIEEVKLYIISFAKQINSGKGIYRAKLIGNYLVKKHQLRLNQIIIVDGGIDKYERIDIYLVPTGGYPPFSNLEFSSNLRPDTDVVSQSLLDNKIVKQFRTKAIFLLDLNNRRNNYRLCSRHFSDKSFQMNS